MSDSTKKRVSIFIDGANMFYTQKKGLGWFFDPVKLVDYLGLGYEIADVFWYMGTRGNETEQQNIDRKERDDSFLKFLSFSGFIIRTKEIKAIKDFTSGAVVYKANLDVEIVMDMFNTIDNFNKVILVSGDGDFRHAIETLRSRGKEVAVVSTTNFIASELRASVGRNYIDLATLRETIERVGTPTQTVEIASS